MRSSGPNRSKRRWSLPKVARCCKGRTTVWKYGNLPTIVDDLLPHLFRAEYRKIVSVLCTRFGFDRMEAAEDIASEAFLAAMQTWPLSGLPPHPIAWLYHVAKNKARNFLQ